MSTAIRTFEYRAPVTAFARRGDDALTDVRSDGAIFERERWLERAEIVTNRDRILIANRVSARHPHAMHRSNRARSAATLLAGIVSFSCGSGSSGGNASAGFGGTAGVTGSGGSTSAT